MSDTAQKDANPFAIIAFVVWAVILAGGVGCWLSGDKPDVIAIWFLATGGVVGLPATGAFIMSWLLSPDR